MTITVFSLDFDGSLHHLHCEDSSFKELNEKNLFLLDYIRNKLIENNQDKESIEDQKAIFLIGSNRQSYDTELANKHRLGAACFEHIKDIVEHWEGLFDPFLLEDLFNDKEPGFSYKRACALLENPTLPMETLNPCPQDKEKILLVFAQIQKISNQFATQSPGEQIDYHFVDDSLSILGSLHHFFSMHPFMIPDNVTLNLTHYANGEEPKSYTAPIQGRGKIQSNYASLTKEMSTQPFKVTAEEEGNIKVSTQALETAHSLSTSFASRLFSTPLNRRRQVGPTQTTSAP